MIHHRNRVLLLVLACPLLWSASADAALPTALKQSTPITQAGTAQITASITAEVAKLTTPNQQPTTLSQARKALIDDGDISAQGAIATPAYQVAYSQAIITALTPLLKTPATQLNAAVIIGGVAAKASRTNSADVFEPIAKVMMADKSWPIALWGVKTARHALADALLNGKKTTLDADIVTAVKANEKSDTIVEEAYPALVLDGIRTDPAYGNCLARSLNSMLDLIVWRTAQYQNGAVPVAPAAESGPANTLPIDGFTMLSSPANAALRVRTLTVLGDLAKAQLGALAAANGAVDPALDDAIIRLGGAINGFGLKLPEPALATAGLQISKLGSNPQPAAVNKCLNDLTNALAPLIAAAPGGAATPGASTAH